MPNSALQHWYLANYAQFSSFPGRLQLTLCYKITSGLLGPTFSAVLNIKLLSSFSKCLFTFLQKHVLLLMILILGFYYMNFSVFLTAEIHCHEVTVVKKKPPTCKVRKLV